MIKDSNKDNLIPHVSSLKTPKGSVRCYDEAIEEEQNIAITTLIASQDHGIHSFEECVPEGSDYLH